MIFATVHRQFTTEQNWLAEVLRGLAESVLGELGNRTNDVDTHETKSADIVQLEYGWGAIVQLRIQLLTELDR